MPTRRLYVVVALAAWICGGLFFGVAAAPGQSMMPGTGPQQMVPYGASGAFASPYPSTATPELQSPSVMAEAGASPVPQDPGRLDAQVTSQPADVNGYVERALTNDDAWGWHVMPAGLMYKSYLASIRESRLASVWVHDRNQGWLWDVTLGGRAGLLRFGTDSDFWPQGWQLDVEGAAFPRLDDNRDLISNDYRIGVPLTTRQGPFEAKFGYYHLCSHLADEFMLSNPTFPRINYVRDSVVLGTALYVNPSLRLYYELGWAFHTDGGAQPWEFQFGADFTPAEPTGFCGAPFFAINGHLRQENSYGGNINVQTGWQWRGRSGHLFRVGMQYFNGMSEQCQFYNRFEEQIGAGLWYDF